MRCAWGNCFCVFKVYICTVIPSLEAMIPLSREAFVKMGVCLVPDLTYDFLETRQLMRKMS